MNGSTIDKIDAKVELDPNVLDVEAPEDNIIDWDIFTWVDTKGYNPDNGFLDFVATTDSAYESTDPNEAFGFIMKVKPTNTSKSTEIKISDVNFKISSPEDELTNLFTDTLSLKLTDLPVTETIEEPVVVDEPVAIDQVQADPVVDLVKTDVETPETWANDIAIALVILWLLLVSFLVIKKEA